MTVEALIATGLAELPVSPAPTVASQLARLTELLARWQGVNLTGHSDADAIARFLVLDAVALAGALPPFETLTDLGSGAGFPGLPLAILWPERRFVLVESRERRVYFQRAAIRGLSLENVEPRRGRAERLSPEPTDGVIAQAVARPTRAVALSIPWCRVGGWIGIPGGSAPPDPGPQPDLAPSTTTPYRVPLEGGGRTLWWARRNC